VDELASTVPAERFRLPAAVYGLLVNSNHVLLTRRTNTGHHDGELGLPSGHLEGGEHAIAGLVRELYEELGVTVDPTSCQLALLMHRAPERPSGNEYLDLIFQIGSWTGEPSIQEPYKCSELVWTESDRLPADTVPTLPRRYTHGTADNNCSSTAGRYSHPGHRPRAVHLASSSSCKAGAVRMTTHTPPFGLFASCVPRGFSHGGTDD
jgi:8-oxo-dGTP diphosphatase